MRAILSQIFREDDLVKIGCSKPRCETLLYRKVLFRSILLKEEGHYQAEYRYKKRSPTRTFFPRMPFP